MVTSISTYTGSSTLQLLRSSGTGSALQDAIAGTASTDTSATNLFNTICPGSTSSTVDGILSAKKAETSKNNIFANVAQRLGAMQAGTYTASDDWEKVASYAMQTGQPVQITLNSKTGKVEAAPQNEADLSKFNVQQQNKLLQTIAQITTMTGKIQANQKNEGMISKLAGAEQDLELVHAGTLAAQSDWETQGSLLMSTHHPFKIALDSTGALTVQDQTTSLLSDYNVAQQKTLRDAIESVPSLISSGTVTNEWEADALAYSESGVSFYLDIDPTTNQVVTKENSSDNITPDFLKTDPYPDIGANTTVLRDAATFIKAGKAFFLDFDTTGAVVAKEATAQNLIKLNNKTSSSTLTSGSGAGTILSLIA